MSNEATLAQLLERNSELFATYGAWAAAQIKLLAGTIDDPESFDAAGGKTGALGYYPVENVSGQIIYVPSLARLQMISAGGGDLSAIEALLSATVQAKDAALVARNDTVGALETFNARLAALEYGGGLQIASFMAVPAIIEAGGSANVAITGAISGTVTGFTVIDSADGTIATTGPAGGFTGAKNGVNSPRTLTLTAQNTGAPDGTDTKTKTAAITFANKGHAGTINKASAITSAEVNAMGQSWFATAVARTLTFTTAADGNLWYSQPASQADPSAFKLGGFNVAADKSIRSHVTATGQTVSYKDFLLSGVVPAGTLVTIEVIA